jgi:hypothetical protein
MRKRRPPEVTSATVIGADVDLEHEEIVLADGSRLTEAVVAEIVDQARRGAGRPSLSGQAVASPQIAFRVPKDVRDRAAELAAREGKTVSQLAREALEARVRAS